jgi:hypothetical protein
MKYIIVLLSLVCNVVFAQSIRVQGIGNTLQQAKENAFKTAVELQVGSVLVNELESKDNKLVRNEIVNYSAGYVDNYTIVDTTTYNNKISIIVDVTVSSSKIADRILSIGSNTKLFDSDRHGTQYETYTDTKNNGDRLLKSLLNDYPKRAFIVTQLQHRFGVDTQRSPFIEIGFKFNWNYNYLSSFNEVLSLIEDGSNGLFKTSPGNIIIMAKDPKDYVLGKKNHYKFNDVLIMESIRNRFENNAPRIQLTIYSQNNNVFFTQCYIPESFAGTKPSLYSMGDTLKVYGNQTENNIIRLHLSNMNDVIRSIERFELTVVGHESCKAK